MHRYFSSGKMLSLFADMSLSLNFSVRERNFVCDFVNCHQKFVSASAVARHVARTHQAHGNSSGKDEICTPCLYKCWVICMVTCPSMSVV